MIKSGALPDRPEPAVPLRRSLVSCTDMHHWFCQISSITSIFMKNTLIREMSNIPFVHLKSINCGTNLG